MALSMMEKTALKTDHSAWPDGDRQGIRARARESESVRRLPSCFQRMKECGCGKSGCSRASASASTAMSSIISGPSVSGGRGRQHVHDGTTVEYTYQPGETRHETYGAGEFKVHDLENLGDKEMVFMTIEFLNSPTSRCRCRSRCAKRRRRQRRLTSFAGHSRESVNRQFFAVGLPDFRGPTLALWCAIRPIPAPNMR